MVRKIVSLVLLDEERGEFTFVEHLKPRQLVLPAWSLVEGESRLSAMGELLKHFGVRPLADHIPLVTCQGLGLESWGQILIHYHILGRFTLEPQLALTHRLVPLQTSQIQTSGLTEVDQKCFHFLKAHGYWPLARVSASAVA